MLRFCAAFLMILLAAPAYAGSRFGGGFHGGFHGGGFSAFHRSRAVLALGFCGGYYGYGYNCGFGFGCGGYDYGYGYGGGGYGYGYGGGGYGYGYGGGGGYGYGYGGSGAGNPPSSGGGFTGGYVPDPVGADIPPVIFPTNCWVRRAAYDPSGAYFGQVLVDLCHSSNNVTVTGLKARAKTPEAGTETGRPAPVYGPGAPQSPPPSP
jgi:hypothetical protein